MMAERQDLHGWGSALRLAFKKALRDTPNTPDIQAATPDAGSLEEASERTCKAADTLELVAAITLNPMSPAALEAGIELALRKLSEDVS